jgi:hypothetical protein
MGQGEAMVLGAAFGPGVLHDRPSDSKKEEKGSWLREHRSCSGHISGMGSFVSGTSGADI